MRLIRDEHEFKEWILDYSSGINDHEGPSEYPCYVERKENLLGDYSHFTYRRDLLEMIERLNDHPG